METVWRVALIYLFLMVGFRIMGKRELGQLGPFDLVVLLLIPELVSQAMIREDFSLTNAFIAVSTLLMLVFFTSVLTHLSKRAGAIVEGEPSVLIHRGFLVPETMNRERISPDEILGEMHKAGIETTSQVKWGILGTGGNITFIPWEPGGMQGRMEEEKVQ